ncbi:MAG TPA: hypothetical protein V6D14_23820 [Coleofasciculaceae cyanobacterium]
MLKKKFGDICDRLVFLLQELGDRFPGYIAQFYGSILRNHLESGRSSR